MTRQKDLAIENDAISGFCVVNKEVNTLQHIQILITDDGACRETVAYVASQTRSTNAFFENKAHAGTWLTSTNSTDITDAANAENANNGYRLTLQKCRRFSDGIHFGTSQHYHFGRGEFAAMEILSDPYEFDKVLEGNRDGTMFYVPCK
eukprot:scaffold609448_cov19-Prasinocladus_malaysianus.AAC.1